MKLPVEGTATVEVSAHITSRKEMGRYIHLVECGSKYNYRATVHINGRMEWQWYETKADAEAWCISKLPKTFKPKR